MFTGLVEKTGTLASMTYRSDGCRLTVSHDAWETPLVPGESVAVQGACLTVTETGEHTFSCDVLEETMKRTSLHAKRTGSKLNLERALRAGDRFGGHFVSGHVDGTGSVQSITRQDNDHVLRIGCSLDLAHDMVEKGSITIDGVSLTISRMLDKAFEVCLIPFTQEHSSLGSLATGQLVNLETDILSKYVRRTVDRSVSARQITLEDLKNAGFC